MATTSGVRPKLKSVAVVARTTAYLFDFRRHFCVARASSQAHTEKSFATERNLRASRDALYARGLP